MSNWRREMLDLRMACSWQDSMFMFVVVIFFTLFDGEIFGLDKLLMGVLEKMQYQSG